MGNGWDTFIGMRPTVADLRDASTYWKLSRLVKWWFLNGQNVFDPLSPSVMLLCLVLCISTSRGYINFVFFQLTPKYNLKCWQLRETKSKQVRRKLSKSCKFDPEGTRGPIGPEVVVLEPWQPGHHASTKKFVDLSTSKSDLLFGRYVPSNLDISSSKKCWVIWTSTSTS